MGNANKDTQALYSARDAYKQYQSDYGNWQNQYNQYRQQADQAWNRDFGASAADYTKKANQSGIQNANQQLTQGANAATNQAQLASRSAGLSKGQAAMNAAGASNQIFQNNWNNAVQSGTQNYGNAVQANQQFNQQGMGNSLQGQQLSSGGMQNTLGVQAQLDKSDWEKKMGTMGAIGGMLTSDQYSKENISQTENGWYTDFIERLSALAR